MVRCVRVPVPAAKCCLAMGLAKYATIVAMEVIEHRLLQKSSSARVALGVHDDLGVRVLDEGERDDDGIAARMRRHWQYCVAGQGVLQRLT